MSDTAAGHQAAPRDGEGFYRYSALRGYWGKSEPGRMDHPVTTICTCGRTIRRQVPDDPFRHVNWDES